MRASSRPAAGGSCSPQPFRSYGLLLIVDCGGGYHAVLAGFDRLDAQGRANVAAGEPVGVMPAWDPALPATGPPLMWSCGTTASRSIRRPG